MLFLVVETMLPKLLSAHTSYTCSTLMNHGNEDLEKNHQTFNNFQPPFNMAKNQSMQKIHFLDMTLQIQDGCIILETPYTGCLLTNKHIYLPPATILNIPNSPLYILWLHTTITSVPKVQRF